MFLRKEGSHPGDPLVMCSNVLLYHVLRTHLKHDAGDTHKKGTRSSSTTWRMDWSPAKEITNLADLLLALVEQESRID